MGEMSKCLAAGRDSLPICTVSRKSLGGRTGEQSISGEGD